MGLRQGRDAVVDHSQYGVWRNDRELRDIDHNPSGLIPRQQNSPPIGAPVDACPF